MGGVGKKARKLGRWADPTTNKYTRVGLGIATGGLSELTGAMPAASAYGKLKKLFKMPGVEDPTKTAGTPAPPPDLTDEAIRDARRRQLLNPTLTGGRKSSFMSGPLGDISKIPLNTKSILG